MSTVFVLGIDQGNTKTHAVICDQSGQILALGQTGGGLHYLTSLDEQMRSLKLAVTNALNQISVTPETISVLYGGLTGADWPHEVVQLTEKVQSLHLAARVCIVNDAYVALRGGSAGNSGVVLIAGTGGNCAIISPDGEKFLYHYYQEDELQGGSAIGRAALNAIYRTETGRGPTTLLTDIVLDHLALSNVDKLLEMDVTHRLPIPISQLAPLVFEAANKNDETACLIIRKLAKGLAELVTAGLVRFRMTELPVEIILSGSIFKANNPILFNTLKKQIHKVAFRAQLIQARYEPVVGAALLALETAGVVISPEIYTNIERTSAKHGLIRSTNHVPDISIASQRRQQ
jgi:N-acetylglucosamine kinase-like BadF-type ATPase